jgi:hypothetical protein
MGAVLDSPAWETKNAYADLDPFEHEQRYLLTRAQAIAFLTGVKPRVTLELYDRARPLSFTRTTYLDDDAFTYFHSCAGGIARRLRLREYALAATMQEVPLLSGSCFLELKQSSGTTRSKIRLAAPPRTLERIIASDPAVELPRLPVPGAEQLAALAALRTELAPATLRPRVTTWYRRTCLMAEQGRVRITLDQDLVFCQPQRLGEPGEAAIPNDIVARGPTRVLEVKYWGDEPDWLRRATSELTAAPRFSKFRMGLLALEPRVT